MKYYFSLMQILLLLAGMKDSHACCCWSKLDDADNVRKSSRLALRKHSDSTCSDNSEGSFSRISEFSEPQKRSVSFSVFTIYEGNFSQDVIRATEEILRTQYQFNRTSAELFMWLKSSLMNNFSYEEPLEKTEHMREHILKYLDERENFFPENYSKKSKKDLVYALQFFLQKRYALLNYCMKIILDQPTETSEFFPIFADKHSIKKNFSKSLIEYFHQHPATQKVPKLEEILSQQYAWIVITSAFNSFPLNKRNFLSDFIKSMNF